MRVRSMVLAGLFAVAITGATVVPVFAGEVTGKGDPTAAPAHTSSICAFSGRNDGNPPPGRKAAHVQNWGQIPKEIRAALAAEGAHPGDACNGHSGFLAGGGGE